MKATKRFYTEARRNEVIISALNPEAMKKCYLEAKERVENANTTVKEFIGEENLLKNHYEDSIEKTVQEFCWNKYGAENVADTIKGFNLNNIVNNSFNYYKKTI